MLDKLSRITNLVISTDPILLEDDRKLVSEYSAKWSGSNIRSIEDFRFKISKYITKPDKWYRIETARYIDSPKDQYQNQELRIMCSNSDVLKIFVAAHPFLKDKKLKKPSSSRQASASQSLPSSLPNPVSDSLKVESVIEHQPLLRKITPHPPSTPYLSSSAPRHEKESAAAASPKKNFLEIILQKLSGKDEEVPKLISVPPKAAPLSPHLPEEDAGKELSPKKHYKREAFTADDRQRVWEAALFEQQDKTWSNKPLAGKDYRSCIFCLDKLRFVDMEVAHIFPASHGGTNDISNLRVSCSGCNRGREGMSNEHAYEWMLRTNKPGLSFINKEDPNMVLATVLFRLSDICEQQDFKETPMYRIEKYTGILSRILQKKMKPLPKIGDKL